jgi:DNA-binding NtrC family response regulator
MSVPLRVLIVEDLEDDALLIARELRRGGYDLTSERVDTLAGFEAAIARQSWDAIIADYAMPNFGGLAALRHLQDMGLDVPFIIVSGTIGQDSAVAAMKAGAHDYVMKDTLARLVPAVQRELREAQSRQARNRAEEWLRESEARYRQSVENSPNPISTVDRQGTLQMWNQACERVFQYRKEEIISRASHQLLWDSQEQVVEDYGGVRDLATQILKAHGYQVLAAENGPEALRISLKHDHPIHLLLTDMVMPGMNGKELAEQIQAQRPGIRIVYMSGYDSRLFEDPSAVGQGVAFLAKPLTVEALAEKVRAVLDLPLPG